MRNRNGIIIIFNLMIPALCIGSGIYYATRPSGSFKIILPTEITEEARYRIIKSCPPGTSLE